LLLDLPQSKTRLPIAIPTLYLWVVDSIALQRGIWSIENGTKLGIQLWSGLEVEEAAFFLITNTMIVFGLVAFDKSVAVLEAFPELYPSVPSVPSPKLLVEALSWSPKSYNLARIEGLRNALAILSRKSRSFYLASGVFRGRLRIDLVILYAYCRIGDDLVDHAKDADDAQRWIGHLTRLLDVSYDPKKTEEEVKAALEPFPSEARSVLSQLPTDRLPAKPLYAVLDGFRSDVSFLSRKAATSPPIRTPADLELYASKVASTVAELCLNLVYYHSPTSQSKETAASKEKCLESGKRMGLALQYTNIARDVVSDGQEGRCYIPTEWFQKPPPPTAEIFQVEIQNLRRRVLDLAFNLYDENKGAIEELPQYARDGIRVAVESYIEIGRTMREKMLRGEKLETAGGGKSGRASVPKLRRLWVGWRTMLGPRGT
jgi:15-cis-phytoene synthase / lycopene beta-cyclase